jgi:hypothetical protein
MEALPGLRLNDAPAKPASASTNPTYSTVLC